MDKKKPPLNENANQNVQSSPEADLLYAQSLSLLNNAIEDCQLDGFQKVESAVPAILDHQGNMKDSLISKTDYFSLAKQLFEQQSPLFSLENIEQQAFANSSLEDLAVVPPNNESEADILNAQTASVEETQVESPEEPLANNDKGLDAINALLNSG